MVLSAEDIEEEYHLPKADIIEQAKSISLMYSYLDNQR